jgi:hypothetical protein
MCESELAQLADPLSNIANRKGLRLATQPFDFIGSPTWARTRDLRINSRWFGSSCRPRQCSLSGVRTSNTFESFASISTGLEPRTTTGYWKRFRPRMPDCPAVLFRRSRHRRRAEGQLHALASRRPSPVESGLERLHWSTPCETGVRPIDSGSCFRCRGMRDIRYRHQNRVRS